MKIVVIFIAGGLGCILRYGLSQGSHMNGFPWVTLFINMVSSFILGIQSQKIELHPDMNPLLHYCIIGFCGGLSTFSTFTSENIVLLKNQQILTAISYVSVSVMACMLVFYLGSNCYSLLCK